MNDRPDLAVLCGADGVHVGQEELPVHDVRRIVGPDMLVGVSTHSIEQARKAVLDGADYLGVGPTFPSTTKSFDAFPGLDLVRAVASEITLPAFAIGGITVENVLEVRKAGLHRIAVGGAVWNTGHSAAPIRSLLESLRS
ncbi:MAG: thiamine phosphate synthase [Pirellulales bacterium]